MMKVAVLCALLGFVAVSICAVTDHTVIVVGTGASGLTAAGTLLAAGFPGKNIIMLEGRETYGGRIRMDTTLGFTWGIGPMWMDGIARYSGDHFTGSTDDFDYCGKSGYPYSLPAGKLCHPVEAIATNYNLEYRIQADYSQYWDYDGTYLGYDLACQNNENPLNYPCAITKGPDSIPNQIVNDWGGNSGYGDDTDTNAMEGWLSWNQPQPHQDSSMEDGMNQCDVDFKQIGTDTVNHTRYRTWKKVSFETCDYGAETYQASWAMFDWDGWFNTRDATLTHGYGDVADILHDRVVKAGVQIQYNTKVHTVDYQTGTVYYTVNGTEGSAHADHVIMSPSFVQYKTGAIKFDPPLSSSYNTAWSHLGQGVLEKAMMTFDTAFWRDYEPKTVNHTGWLMYMSDTHGEWPEFNTMDNWLDQPALLAWAPGDFGREAVMKTDEETRDRLQEIINMMYPTAGNASQIKQMYRSNWTNDEWTLGCYSFWAVGFNPHSDGVVLQETVGKVYWAGEHTRPDHPASVEGAIWSGQDAANKVCKSAGGCKTYVHHPDTIADAVRWTD